MNDLIKKQFQVEINIKEQIEQNKGRTSNKTQFPHQEKAFKKLSEFYQEPGKRGLLVLPTGGGGYFEAR